MYTNMCLLNIEHGGLPELQCAKVWIRFIKSMKLRDQIFEDRHSWQSRGQVPCLNMSAIYHVKERIELKKEECSLVDCYISFYYFVLPFLLTMFSFCQVDIFQKDLLLIPIHLEVHWSLVSVDIPRRAITYFDSQRTLNRRCPKVGPDSNSKLLH